MNGHKMVTVVRDSFQADTLKGNLISRTKSGDIRAFEEMVKMYQKKVFNLAYGHLMNRDDAMEIVQDTFLKVFSFIHTLRDENKFEPWLYTIANNVLRDKQRKYRKSPVDNLPVDEDGACYDLTNPGNELDCGNRELKESLKKTIQLLPGRQKTIIIMRYFQDMKIKEIAEILGISIGTVKKLHFKAIEKLRKNAILDKGTMK